jgi:hypothetical protein
MVLNLRGDCKDHQPQLDFLSAISSVVVVFHESLVFTWKHKWNS